MALRVTQTMMSNQLIRNINNNMSRLSNWQTQLSTGRVINKPSDDPVGVTYALRYRSELTANTQYQSNVDSALSWLEFTDMLLGQVGDIVKRAKELTLQGSTGTNPQVAMNAVANEIIQLKEQLVNIANSQLAGKYVFNGQMYDRPPYPNLGNAGTTETDDGAVYYEVGIGTDLTINVTGNQVFGRAADQDNLFQVLERIANALLNGDKEGAAAEMNHLDSRYEKVVSVRSEVGAKTNRVELMQNRLLDLELNVTKLQSKTEDADIAEVLMRYQTDENVYRASLAMGSRVILTTLLDFLR